MLLHATEAGEKLIDFLQPTFLAATGVHRAAMEKEKQYEIYCTMYFSRPNDYLLESTCSTLYPPYFPFRMVFRAPRHRTKKAPRPCGRDALMRLLVRLLTW
jgi:hypothetical protein